MQQYGYADSKEQLLKRLSRAEGQVRGIARMVENDTYCIDILTQIGAVQAALDKVALGLLREHTKHCLASEVIQGDAAYKTDELINAVERLMKVRG